MKINQAMYCWNSSTHKAAAIQWPAPVERSEYDSSAGACERLFHSLTFDQQRTHLLCEAFKSVVHDGVHPSEAYEALCGIDGMQRLLEGL